MKSSLDKLEGLQRKLTIEFPENKVSDAFNRVYKGIQKNTTIKGFRKGKAPMTQVKSMYVDRVKSDVLQNLISEGYEKALDEHSLNPIGQPQLDYDGLEESKSFKFSAAFEVRPEIELKNYEGLKVEAEKLEISDDQIEETVENIRKSRATNKIVEEDRAVKDLDVAEIDFEGFVDGTPLDNGKGESHMLDIGAKSFIEGFEEGIIGMKKGETKELKLNFPKEYHASDIAGKDVTFKVALKAIHEKVNPELNEEFAKSLGAGFESITDLKDRIKKDIQQNEEKRIKDDLKSSVLKALTKANPFSVPDSMLTSQRELITSDTTQRLKQQGLDENGVKEYLEKWKSDLDETALFMVQSSFLIDSISEKYKLFPSKEDINAKLAEQSMMTGIELDKIKEYYKPPEKKSQLRYQIIEEKVVNFLISKADVKEVPKDQLKEEKLIP